MVEISKVTQDLANGFKIPIFYLKLP